MMAIHAAHNYSITLEPLSSPDALRESWQALETRGQPACFLRWYWIETWLETYSLQPLLARIKLADETVALGLFVIRHETRRGILRSRVAYLHQTGDPRQDQIWVEYNGLLAEPQHRRPALRACCEALLARGLADEIRLSMLPDSIGQPGITAVPDITSLPGVRCAQAITGHVRDLAALRAQGRSALDGLTANTRQQIRRSLRGYTRRYGEPALSAAGTADEAVALFRKAGHRHRQRWPDSGFDNPAFTRFHETLIKRGIDHNTVSLMRVSAGGRTVGVFFYLLAGETVYFYLQGVQPETDSKLKPGLMSHALLMQHFLERGASVYDFMGGDSQYKRQLADRTTSFMVLQWHNGALRFRLEDAARALRNRYRPGACA